MFTFKKNNLSWTPTSTHTATRTVTPTDTPTLVVNTPTLTITPTLSPQPTQEVFEIKEILSYPNPINPDRSSEVLVGFYLTQNCSELIFYIYTTAYRCVRKIEISGNFDGGLRHIAHIESSYLQGLSSGIYFYVFRGKNDTDEIKRSEIGKIIILH